MERFARRANPQPGHRLRVISLAAFLAAAIAPPSAFSCGYENPSDLALGLMNWVFPKALHVRTAVWQAEQSGILPPRSAKPAKDMFGGGFRRAAASLNGLGERLSATSPANGGRASFSVVLIPAVLWTTYSPAAGGYSVQVHADGPANGDVVIVTDEKVVRALADGSLTAAAAESNGLVRYYGAAGSQDQVRAALAGLPVAKGGPLSSPASYNPD